MKKWIFDGETEFTDARDAAEYIVNVYDHDAYDDMLDDCYGDIEICGLTYSASIALRLVDEIAYNCDFNDWLDGEMCRVADELESMEDGDELEFYGFTVECAEDDEGE